MKWLPVGFESPGAGPLSVLEQSGENWQVYLTRDGYHRVLVVLDLLHERWIEDGLVEEGTFKQSNFSSLNLYFFPSKTSHTLSLVERGIPSLDAQLAQSFAVSLRDSRRICPARSFHDSIFVEALSRLLPVYSLSEFVTDDVLLGKWLSKGLDVSVNAGRKFRLATAWLADKELARVLHVVGFMSSGSDPDTPTPISTSRQETEAGCVEGRGGACTTGYQDEFSLPGRESLADFFNDHVIDIVKNIDRYAAMGIGFPAPIVLYGPPGTGKTFAIERLSNYLGWPLYEISAASIGSPYIHETSKKVSQIFDKAMETAPSLIVIDEMDAYLSDRSTSSGQHNVEEVSEFLRLIPVARDKGVLVVGMTNRLESIDPAILRKGRFDHVVKVDVAGVDEIEHLLENLITRIPVDKDLDIRRLAERLEGHPLSDVSFVLREAGRIAVKARKLKVSMSDLDAALALTDQNGVDTATKKIGFI
jgi:cell division protease FtsH